jgi:hypothetical protein
LTSITRSERIVGDPQKLRQVIEMLGQTRSQGAGQVALSVELESETSNQVCLHFSFAGVRHFGTDVEETSVAKRLAVRLLALMGGRVWGDAHARSGLQFHAMFALPTQMPRPPADEHTSALTGSAVN